MRADRPPNNMPLDDVKDWVFARLEDGGVRCPACGQHAQAYRRRVTKAMVTTLGRMLFAEKGPGDFVRLPEIPQRSRDSTMLAYWGLIEEEKQLRPDGGRTGWWRVTDAGLEFLYGKTRIFTYAHVYNGERYGFSGPQITVHDVAPRFSLNRLREESRA